MKKVLSSLVVLGILLCMFMSLGISADAAEGPKDLAVVAVAGDALTADHINNIKQSLASSDVVIVDINGLDFEQSGEGYNYAYVEGDQGFEPGGYSYIWGGMPSAPSFTVTDDAGSQCTVVLLPVGGEDTVESINAAVDSCKTAGTAVVIAVAPDNSFKVQEAVESNADKVLTCGEPGVSSDKLIKVGGDSANPVSLVRVAASGAVSVEAMPLPAASDPGVGPVEQAEDEPETAATAYTVSLLPGDEGQGEIISSEPIAAGGTYTLPSCEFSAMGYDFSGWLLSSDGLVHQPDETIEVGADITATATWTAQIQQVNVNFEANLEGVEVDGHVDPATVDAGSTLSLPANGFTAEGYTFQGWDVNGETKQPGEEITVNGYMTVNATWQQTATGTDTASIVESCTVTYKPGEGATGEDVTITYNKAERDGMFVVGYDYTDPENAKSIIDEGKFTPTEGMTFAGWVDENEVSYGPNENYNFTEETKSEMTLTAQWTKDQQYTISFYWNGSKDDYEVTAKPGDSYPVNGSDVIGQAAPDGQQFTGWLVTVNDGEAQLQKDDGSTEDANGKVVQESDQIIVNGNLTLTAQFGPIATTGQDVTVTYKSGLEGVADVTEQHKTGDTITALTADKFSKAEGKELTSWQCDVKISDEAQEAVVVALGQSYTIPANATEVVFTAQWKDTAAKSATNTPGVDLTFVLGGTDNVSLGYSAVVDAENVILGGAKLTMGSQFGLSDGDKTLFFPPSFLNELRAGTYVLKVSFKADADGTTYAQDVRNLVIKSNNISVDPPAATTAPSKEMTLTWDRAHDLVIDLSQYNMGSPTKVEIKYSDTDWREVKAENYTVSGTTLTLKTSMLPANWPNQGYTYRVTFGNAPMTVAANGTATNTVQLNLKVIGNVSTVANPTATPVANATGGTSPVTGDTNNVTLYVVLLVVLIAALAAVIIIVMKRKKR